MTKQKVLGKIEITWLSFPLNWIKINTDEASKSKSLMVGCVELFRDVDGNWLYGFVKPMDFVPLFKLNVGE